MSESFSTLPSPAHPGDRLARGTIFSVTAQIAAAALGFGLTLFLARRLGPATFGRYGVVISFLAWAEFLVITGIPDAAARAIAAEGDRRRGVLRAGLQLEALFAAMLFALFWLTAPWFSSTLFHNPSLTGPFRLAALDIPFYALFSIYLGYIRGIRGFARQSGAIVFYAAAKFLSVTVLILAGFSLKGALLGNAAGSLAALLLARLMVSADLSRSPARRNYPARALTGYALPLVAGVLLYNALISVDLWMVERLVAQDSEVGLYTAAWNMARTPYFLFMGLAVVLFPALSRFHADGDREKSRRTLEEACRLYLIIAVPLVLFAALTSSELMGLAFNHAYQPQHSGPLFAVLIPGYALLSFNLISNAALAAAGRLGLVVSINAVLLVSQVALTSWLIPLYGLPGAALATLLIGAASFMAGQACLSRFFGSRLMALPVLRVIVAALPALALARILPIRGWLLILAYAALGLVYLAGLLLLGELTWDEIIGYGAQFRSRR